jgi:hypothetical protein
MNRQNLVAFNKVVTGKSYKHFQRLVMTAFDSEQSFSNWIYDNGANLYSYIHSIDYKDSVTNVGFILESVFKQNGMTTELDEIKKDKSSYRFISSWLKSNGRPVHLQSSLAKMPSGKRNLYSTLLCVLLNHTREAQ